MATMIDSPSSAVIGTAEAAERLGVHANTVRAMAKDGRLPSVRLGTGLRFRISDLDALMTP